jgi:hypothetical protein
MLLHRYAEYVLRGRREAVMCALIFSAIPFMGWLGMATMALVALRKGAVEGLFILMWIALPSLVLAVLGHPVSFLYGIIGGGMVVWLLAIVLRSTASWLMVLQLATLIGLFAVLIVHLWIDDVPAYWVGVLQQIVKPLGASLKQQQLDVASVIGMMSQFATGLIVVFFALSNLTILLIGRWMQSLIYNPGGLQAELYNIRLGYAADIIFVALIAAVLSGFTWAWDFLPVVVMMFFVAGLSLVHALAAHAKNMWTWLGLFYGLLIILLPYMLGLIVTAAIIDTWGNLRGRLVRN